MIVYHFCCKRDAKRIMKEGITLGHIPIWDDKNQRFVLRAGFQWLTTDSDPDAQSWDTHYLLRYSRTEVRIKIDIPDAWLDHLLDMHEMQQLIPQINPKLYEDWYGNENWRVYRGSIPKKWIVQADEL